MKKNILILLFAVCFSRIFLSFCFAQTNPELIGDLNYLLTLDIQLIEECEYNSDVFDISIPYNKIINEKHRMIDELAGLIDSLGAELSDKRFNIQKLKRNYQALNADANLQIKIIEIIDAMLLKYGHPKVQIYLKKAKDQAYLHFMILSNAAQKIIGENRVEDVLNIR